MDGIGEHIQRIKGDGIYDCGGDEGYSTNERRITRKGSLRVLEDAVDHSSCYWFPKGGRRKQEANVDKEERVAGLHSLLSVHEIDMSQ